MFKLLLVACTLAMASAAMSWKNCGSTSDICPPTNVTMSPDPAPRGGSSTFTVTCSATQVTTGGKIVIDAYMGGSHVKHEEYNFCDIQKCPAPTGQRIDVQKESIPSLAPKGAQITTHTVATDQTGKQISCLEINFQVS